MFIYSVDEENYGESRLTVRYFKSYEEALLFYQKLFEGNANNYINYHFITSINLDAPEGINQMSEITQTNYYSVGVV